MQASPPIIMVSGCLLGISCRYDGKIINSPECRLELKRLGAIWIPFCPEQLGGLTTPRNAANIIRGDGHDVLDGAAKVITRSGEDVTKAFILGAEQVLTMAKQQATAAVFLKARSPSCGVGARLGVTAALLVRNGFALKEF